MQGQLVVTDCATEYITGVAATCGLVDSAWGYDCLLPAGTECLYSGSTGLFVAFCQDNNGCLIDYQTDDGGVSTQCTALGTCSQPSDGGFVPVCNGTNAVTVGCNNGNQPIVLDCVPGSCVDGVCVGVAGSVCSDSETSSFTCQGGLYCLAGDGGPAGSGSGTCGAANTCGRPPTAIGTDNSFCNTSDECQCGLSCVTGSCLQVCAVPDVQDTCDSGEICVALVSGENVCLRQAGLDESCYFDVCGAGLECQATAYDYAIEQVIEFTCHEACLNDLSCDMLQECLPSSAGFFDVQPGDGGPARCNPDAGGDAACDTTNGFGCNALAIGNVCSREQRACGTPVPLADTRSPDAGGNFTADMLCNLGPRYVGGGASVEGSRFCDTFSTLPSPPEVFCITGTVDLNAPSLGYCVGICSDPNRGGTVTDCPAGTTCSTTNATYFSIVDTNPGVAGTQYATCTVATDCNPFPGSICMGPFSSTGSNRVCALPYGECSY